MQVLKKMPIARLLLSGLATTLAVLLLIVGIALSRLGQTAGGERTIASASVFLLTALTVLALRVRRLTYAHWIGEGVAQRIRPSLLEFGGLQIAMFNSANFSSVAADAHGIIQIFNVGAGRMLGYQAGRPTFQRHRNLSQGRRCRAWN